MQVIHARCDEVMRLLAEELHLELRPNLSEGGKLCRNSFRQPLNNGKIYYEDIPSEHDDQRLLEFERSFMVQMTDSVPPI